MRRVHALPPAARLLPLALVGLAGSARADSPPQITVRPSANEVEVGEPFTVELKAMVNQGSSTPSDPELRPQAGFTVDGPSLSTQTMINGFGPRSQVSIGIGATWRLIGQRPGHFTIGPPTIAWNGRRLAGSTVTVDVVPATGRPRRRPSNNPFLLPGGPGGPGFNIPWPFQHDAPADDDAPVDPGSSPEFALPTAPDPLVFVRAMADKRNVVVGEQVAVSFYIYHSQSVHLSGRTEAAFSDFLRVPLIKDPRLEPGPNTTVGGRRFRVQLIDKVALFPIHSGDLRTGSMRLTFSNQYGRRIGERASDDIVIHVSEPPRMGRPPGYVLGDVGQWTLAAELQPRRIEQGGSVAVTLKVAGTGNLPQALRLPERNGVEWLDPEKKESIEPQNGLVAGWRTFGYVVRVRESGRVNLGEVTLPYWDPAAKAYQVATARLGVLDVKPMVSTATDPVGSADAPKADAFAGLPAARAALGAYAPPRRRFEVGPLMWLIVAAPPFAVGLVSAGAGALRRAVARRAERKDTPAAHAARALRDAHKAEKQGDLKAMCAALERAVHLAVEGATGLKSRGVLLAELPGELEKRGLGQPLAAAAAGVLASSEAIRFEPDPDTARARALAAQARTVVADLKRHKAS